MSRRLRHAAAMGLLAALVAACGSSKSSTTTSTNANGAGGSTPSSVSGKEIVPPGDIPDTQAFVAFTSASGRFTIKYPEGWAKQVTGSTTTFRSQFTSMVVTEARAAAAPTVATARAVEVPKLAATQQQFRLASVASVRRPAGDSVRIAYRAVSGTDPVTGKTILLDVERYEFFRTGTLVTVTLASPYGSDNVDAWRTITSSLTWM